MRSDLRDKVVCITGAAGGIGRAIAKAFAWEGADLALLDRDKTGVEDLAAALRTTGVTVQTAVVDLRTAHGVRQGMQTALAPFGVTLTRFCGVSERGNSLGLLLIGDRTEVS